MTTSSAGLLRAIYPRVLARTLGVTRSLPEAEDAVQEAVVRALSVWPERGLPAAPEAWLTKVATRVHLDRARKARRSASAEPAALETLAAMSPWIQSAVAAPDVARGFKDELLRLVFACCHPSLEPGEAAGLCLATVVGLSLHEIAAAFTVELRTMEQRLTRARRRLRERGDLDHRTPEQSREHLPAVLMVVHLLFNEGYWSTQGDTPIVAELCRLAIGLGHALVALFPEEHDALALLALMLLHDARRPARLDEQGRAVKLPDQDRGRWDRDAIALGERILARAGATGRGAYYLEASIAACHTRAATAEATDWPRIAALYAALELQRPTPAVRVNRAFAVGRAEGAAAGLALLEALDGHSYPYVDLVRGHLAREAGDHATARRHLKAAADRARNRAEREDIERQLARLEEP